jgi:hypothetical protein
MSRFLFEFGICRPDQYVEGSQAARAMLENRISYQLLVTSIPPSAAEIARFEGVMREIQLPGGVFRTTAPDRFREFDEFMNGVLARSFPAQAALDVHDWAASDCSASAAWFETLRHTFADVRMTASDLNLYLIEARVASGESYILDAVGEAVQYIRPPFVIRMSTPEPRFMWWNRLLRKRALARLARLRQQGLPDAATLDFAGSDEVHSPPYVFRKIPMVHPAAEMLRRSGKIFRVERYSVFESLAQPADVIRTMNIFNPGYFGQDRLRQGATSVWRSLKPGGIWIVGRTVEKDRPVHHASVLVRAGQGFASHERYMQKSEMEDLALALRLDE